MNRPEIVKGLTERAREHKKAMLETRQESEQSIEEEPATE